jgi:excinuclease ABC subunit C
MSDPLGSWERGGGICFLVDGVKEKIEMDVKARAAALPIGSGVYLMKNAEGQVVYVGKAISLRRRVRSYFQKTSSKTKTDLLVREICDIDYRETASEAEALILESALIKEHGPKYNVSLRDDKSYPLIEITDEPYPRVSVCRPRARKPGARYFGPYVNAILIREALKVLRRIFYFRTDEKLDERIRLDYQIGLVEAPRIEDVDVDNYQKNIENLCLILEGKTDVLYRTLTDEMEALSRELRFEDAARVRDQLRAIGALYSGTKDVNYFKEAEQVQRALGLNRMPERIECFDISNLMGKQAVGSMVSFWQGRPDKKNYRRFRIRDIKGIDDFAMIAEIVRRRYRRLRDEKKPYPDLIVIDGGKGQLGAAVAQLVLLGVDIPLCSLAKREEEIFLPGKRMPVILKKESLGLQLLQRVRDEAHRFAVEYHKKLRSKEFFISSASEIEKNA